MIKKIYASVLLKDNKIMSYKISPQLKKSPEDFYKDFFYAGYNLQKNNLDNFEVKWMGFEFLENNEEDCELNNYVFENISRTFFKKWEIHPEHFGSIPYENNNQYELGYAQGSYDKEEDMKQIIDEMAKELSKYGYDNEYLSGTSLTEWECSKCHKKYNWNNAKVPKICYECIKKEFLN